MVARSHPGLVRLNNEDTVFADTHSGLAVVADGMGGLFAGEEASAVAVEAVRRQVLDERCGVCSCADVEQIVRHAHDVLLEYAETLSYVGKMGTTLIFWIATGDTSFFAHIGDSRLYQLGADGLVQHSRDDTLAQRMVDMGNLSERGARLSPKRHVLTQGLGLPGFINPQTAEITPEGRLLLCSDGLSDKVSAEHLATALGIKNMDEAATELLRLALDAGGDDNISMVLIDP